MPRVRDRQRRQPAVASGDPGVLPEPEQLTKPCRRTYSGAKHVGACALSEQHAPLLQRRRSGRVPSLLARSMQPLERTAHGWVRY